KRAAEAELKARVAGDPKLRAEIGDPWSEIEQAQAAYADQYVRYRQLEAGAGSLSELFEDARTLVRAAQGRAKQPADRLPEYAEARLPALERSLTDPTTVSLPLEQLYLEFWLSKTREYLTVDDPASKLLLGKE